VSLVTKVNQPSSNITIRLEKLQKLYQVLTNNEPNQRISKVFTKLGKIDRQAVRTMSSAETIGRKYIINKIAMRNAVERHMRALKKAEQVFKTGVVKDRTKCQGALPNSSKQLRDCPQTINPSDSETLFEEVSSGFEVAYATGAVGASKPDERSRKRFEEDGFRVCGQSLSKNPLVKLPQDVLAKNVLPFLTEKERGDLRSSCRDTRKIQTPASSIIKTYHLESLIETYLHVSSSNLIPSDKAKTLHKLLSVAYSLSEIEKFPRPTYLSLPAFFQEVEARNLIRMIETICNARPLLNLPTEIEDLYIPNDPTSTMQKADRLRDWIHQHQGAIAAIEGTLYLGNKDFSLLPKEIDQLKALQGLHLYNNCLVSIPKEIGQLHALQKLSLSDNRLVNIPKEIGQLKALQELYLNRNCLVSVPKEIDQLKVLQGLYLYNNRLVSIPKEIGQLKALQWFDLGNNRLVSVPKEIGQLKALQWFALGNNRLVSVPKEIGQLKALKELYLNRNCLVSIPKEIGQLKALKELYLNRNCLVSIPKEIGQLKALKELYLNRNCLVSIPKEIGQLKALKKLRLKNNKLMRLPQELDRFKDALKKQNQ